MILRSIAQICKQSKQIQHTSQGVRFMKSRYLKPLADEIKEGILQYHERESSPRPRNIKTKENSCVSE